MMTQTTEVVLYQIEADKVADYSKISAKIWNPF